VNREKPGAPRVLPLVFPKDEADPSKADVGGTTGHCGPESGCVVCPTGLHVSQTRPKAGHVYGDTGTYSLELKNSMQERP